MLDYRIYTFLKLCETMNYRKTAQLLNMTQPAVTQHIKFLEKEYGNKLFNYSYKKLSKTKSACILEEYSRSMLQNEIELNKHINTSNVNTHYIGATKTIGEFVIKNNIANFLKNTNDTISLTVDNTAILLNLLKENKLDYAIIEGNFDKTKFDYKLFKEEAFLGICSKKHSFANKSINLKDLFNETIIVREQGSGTRNIIENVLSQYSYNLDNFSKQICIDNFNIIKHLVKCDLGISFVYNSIAKSDDELATFTIKDNLISREFNYVFLKHLDISTTDFCI